MYQFIDRDALNYLVCPKNDPRAFCVVTTQDDMMLIKRKHSLSIPQIGINSIADAESEIGTNSFLQTLLALGPTAISTVAEINFLGQYRFVLPKKVNISLPFAVEVDRNSADLQLDPVYSYEWVDLDAAEDRVCQFQVEAHTSVNEIDSSIAVSIYLNEMTYLEDN